MTENGLKVNYKETENKVRIGRNYIEQRQKQTMFKRD